MSVKITVGEINPVGPTASMRDETPRWGVIFNLNREDGVGTAIGITVRCDDPLEARQEAAAMLQAFLSEATEAAKTLPDQDDGGVRSRGRGIPTQLPTVRTDESVPLEGCHRSTSAPIPKFVSYRGTLVYELRNQRSTSNLLILVRLLNLKFLFGIAARCAGTSNSPH